MVRENLSRDSIYGLFKEELNRVGYGFAQTLYRAVEASGYSAAEIKSDDNLYSGLYAAATDILIDSGFSKNWDEAAHMFMLGFDTALKNEKGFGCY